MGWNISTRLRELMEERKWDAKTTARKTGIRLAKIYNIRTGMLIGIKVLDKICSGFGVERSAFVPDLKQKDEAEDDELGKVKHPIGAKRLLEFLNAEGDDYLGPDNPLIININRPALNNHGWQRHGHTHGDGAFGGGSFQ